MLPREEDLDFIGTIKDPVHGHIPITQIEKEILTLDILTRLRGVKQMGLLYLDYPGATHTRYEHSIGVMHVAYLMAKIIKKIGPRKNSEKIDRQSLQLIRLSALLHDVGHPPFSHCVENALRMMNLSFEHSEHAYNKIINDPWLDDIIGGRIYTKKDVAQLASGRDYRIKTYSKIISGPIDADKIDYILRDNLHCGFSTGANINLFYSLEPVFLIDDSENLVVSPAGFAFVEQLFLARYHLKSEIQHNRVNRIGNYILSLALKEAFENKIEELESPDEKQDQEKLQDIIINEILNYDDSDLLNFLKKYSEEYYPILHEFMNKKSTVTEMVNFDYNDIPPDVRYEISFISKSENLNYLRKMRDMIKTYIKHNPNDCVKLFPDIYYSKPPEIDIKACKNIKISPASDLLCSKELLITDIPPILGAINAHLYDVHAAIYSKNNFFSKNFEVKKLLEDYSKIAKRDFTLLDTKCANILDDKEKVEWLFKVLLELAIIRSGIDIRSKIPDRITTSDFLLLVLFAFYNVFNNTLKHIVFVSSLTELLRICNYILNSIEKPYRSKIMHLTKTYLASTMLSTQMVLDINTLILYGLAYAINRVNVYQEIFHHRSQIRISGWGRRYISRLMDNIPLIKELEQSIEKLLYEKIKNKKKTYIEFIKLCSKDFVGNRLKELKRDLPIKIDI